MVTANLHLVAGNARFLILPHVHVPSLALGILARAARQLPAANPARDHRTLTTKRRKGEVKVATVLIFHEVNDVDHWLHSPKRQEVFGPMGITARLFVDPAKANRVGLIVEVPDMETFQQVMQSEEAADAMRFDGVRPDTVVVLAEAPV